MEHPLNTPLVSQVVDMRWGIRNEASVDHSASELCMNEIENCKSVSVGPTFVVSSLFRMAN